MPDTNTRTPSTLQTAMSRSLSQPTTLQPEKSRTISLQSSLQTTDEVGNDSRGKTEHAENSSSSSQIKSNNYLGVLRGAKHVILISENALWQESVAAATRSEPVLVTRTQLLGSDWLNQQQRLMNKAVLVLIELPHTRTATGNRSDRRLCSRILHWIMAAQGLGA